MRNFYRTLRVRFFVRQGNIQSDRLLFLLGTGVFVIRRLQDDMQYSAGGEKFNIKYIWQSLRDWKTWVASEYRI